MILSINTGTEKNSIALYKPSKIKDEIVWQTSKTQSQELLPKIDQLLKSNQVKLSDLKAIGVFQGPGSYTGLRVGISVANTLAWSLNIPVIGFQLLNCQMAKLSNSKNQFNPSTSLETGNLTIKQFNNYNALDIAKKVQELLSNKKNSEFTKIIEPIYQNTI